MARTLTAPTIASSEQRLGSEPIVIVRVDWVGGTRYYSDKTFVLGTLNIEGRITNFGTVSSKINDRTYGGVDSANVTLSDIDGTLKTIFDSEIIEKRLVTVYHHFEGNAEADLATILVGKLMSTIVWSEGERTLSFEVSNDWDSDDLLLEIKETSVDFPSEESVGTVFPLCFGTVIRLPGVRVSRVKTGKLLTPIFSYTTWFRDPSDPTTFKFTYKNAEFDVSDFEDMTGSELVLEIGGCLFRGSFTSDRHFECRDIGSFNISFPSSAGMSAAIGTRDDQDGDYYNASCAWIQAVGSYDLVGKFVKIRYMQEYYFVETNSETGTQIEELITSSDYSDVKDSDDDSPIEVQKYHGYRTFVAQVESVDEYNNKVFFSRPCQDKFGRDVHLGGSDLSDSGEGASIQQVKGQIEYEWDMLPSEGSPYRWDIGPGATVKIYDPLKPDLYVFNSVASEDTWYLNGQPVVVGTPLAELSPGIFEVACKKDGVLYLIPESLYTINLANVLNVNGNMETLTTIELKESMEADGWDISNVYASLHSTIHSNTATDVINWIALNRTTLIPNAINFAAIGVLIDKYPSHFPVLTQRDSLAAIQEIAWLARLGVFIDASGIFLNYLAKEPTTYVFEALTDNIRFKSMSITKTSSDDLFTKFKSEWIFSYAEDVKNKIKSDNNVDIYGEEDFDIENSIYNIKSLVQKCHDFWEVRKSNCWYTIEIDTFLTSLVVQIWDPVRVNVSFINGGTPIIGHVIGIGHDSVSHQIVLTVWLPLKQGEGSAYQIDTADVKPDDPGIGLSTLDYSVLAFKPVRRAQPSLFKRGRNAPVDSDGPTDFNIDIESKMATLALGTFQVELLGVGPNALRCRIIDASAFSSEVYEYSIENNILQEDNILYVAKPIPIREQTWKDKTVGGYSYTKVDANTRLSTKTGMPNETQEITPSYVTQAEDSEGLGQIIIVQYQPKGTGLVSKKYGKCVWQEVGTRHWAKIEDPV